MVKNNNTDIKMDTFTDKRSGMKFCMPLNNDLIDSFRTKGIDGYNLIEWCKQFLSENSVFIDIGAYIGTYSIILSKYCKDVFAFEPRSKNYDSLTIGISINNIFNIKANRIALGYTEYISNLKQLSVDGSNCTLSSDATDDILISEESITVKSLDSYDIKNVDFIKINTCGCELDIIKGSLLTLIKNKFPPILIKPLDNKEELFNFMSNLGYKIHPISGYSEYYLLSDHQSRSEKSFDTVSDIDTLIKDYEDGKLYDSDINWNSWHILSRHYRQKSKHQKSYDCAHKGILICPYDKKFLFYEEISIVSFYLNKMDEGFDACEKVILSNHSPWETRNLTLSNEGFYMKPLPMKRKIKIDHPLPDYYSPSSASIIKSNTGYRINLRAINYYNSYKGYGVSRHDDGIIRTINYLLDTDIDFNIIRFNELVDNSGVTLYPKNILGMEDVRLFSSTKSDAKDACNYFFCTYLELNNSRTPQIGWGTYDSTTGTVTRMVPLMVGSEIKCEKNWLPFIDNDEIYIIYAMGPFQLYKLDKESGSLTEVMRSSLGDGLTNISPRSSPETNYINDFRGSASPIPYKNGWLFTIHQVHFNEPRKYFHRFVWFNKDFTNITYSIPFFFEKVGVEFNLSVCHSDDGLLITYSHNDSNSIIGIVDYDIIDSMLGL